MGKTTYAVIGLGQFGSAVCEELVSLGYDVIAIDSDGAVVKKMSAILPTVFIADSSDEEALKEVGIKDVDVAIVAFGDSLEATVLTTVLLKDLGVPQIIVRVDDPHYINIIKKIGASEIISPQQAAGTALAHRLGSADYKDYYNLDTRYSVVAIEINPKFVTRTLSSLNSKNLFGVNIVLIQRNKVSFVPGGNDSIQASDKVYVVGTAKEIKAFREAINGKHKI